MKQALRINAIFSSVSGILLILFHNWFQEIFDLGTSTPFWITGIALIVFAGSILLEIKRQNPAGILWIVVQDILWVIGSIVLLVWNPFGISASGNLIIATVAGVVLLMAFLQARALAALDRIDSSRQKVLRYEREVSAPRKAVWDVVSDVANYHSVAPNIDAVEIISGTGEGMVRSCAHGKDSWTETCTLWQEGSEYAFLVQTGVPGYPFPFKHLQGSWRVHETGPKSTRIEMEFAFVYKRKWQDLVAHLLAKGKFNKIAEELLDNWQAVLKDEGQ